MGEQKSESKSTNVSLANARICALAFALLLAHASVRINTYIRMQSCSDLAADGLEHEALLKFLQTFPEANPVELRRFLRKVLPVCALSHLSPFLLIT